MYAISANRNLILDILAHEEQPAEVFEHGGRYAAEISADNPYAQKLPGVEMRASLGGDDG